MKLLGVKMDGSEHFLVLELMDGGDMLNFLRDWFNINITALLNLLLIADLKRVVLLG